MSRSLLPATLAGVVVASVVWLASAAPDGSIACRVLPNGRVSLVPDLLRSCPLPAFAQVRVTQIAHADGRVTPGPAAFSEVWTAPQVVAVRLQSDAGTFDLPVERSPRVRRVARASLALAAVFAWMGSIGWALRARSAGRPLLASFGASSGLVFVSACGLAARASGWIEAVALLLLPCTLAHLALWFPEPRRLVSRVPWLAVVPYALAASLLPVAWRAFERDALLWPAFCLAMLFLAGSIWVVLAASCAFRIRESQTPLVRAHARLILYGSVPLALVWAVLLFGVSRTHSPFGTLPLLAALFVLPLPMALALSGYDAFELPRDLRRVLLGGAAAGGIASLGVTLFAGAAWAVRGSPAADHWELLGAAVSCLAVAEVSRRIARPASSWLDPASGAFEQRLARFASATLRDEDAAARDLMALLRVLPFRRGELFALGSRAPERRAQFGAVPNGSTSWVRTALDLVGTDLRAELWRFSAARRAAARALLDREVDLVLALRHGDQTLGIVLLTAESGRPPSRAHVALAETACAHAATAIANARLAEELVALERRAATGRAALALAHDLGKELDWIRHLAMALPDRIGDRDRVRRDLDTIAVLATERAQALRGLVRRARDGAAARSATLAELIGEAATRARRRLCGVSLRCTIDRDVCDLPVHGDLSFVIDELLDNAVRAAPHLPVDVRASRRGDRLRVVVSDRGIGLDPSWSLRAFEPGFTTRGPDGCGMGLAIVRETVRSLGGEIALAPGADQGTSFCVDLPCG